MYDAAGTKLTMIRKQNGAQVARTDYTGSFVYENSNLTFFGSPEGRVLVKPSGSTLAFEYQYAIADHQGNTRVVFSEVNKSETIKATFEGNSADASSTFSNVVSGNIVPHTGANKTTGGSKVIRMNQTYKIGPSKGIKVYPGDRVAIEVYEYHEGTSGFGSTSTSQSALIALVANAFGGVSGGAGESGKIFSGVQDAITTFNPPGNQGSSRPAAYLNYILFDKNYKVLDMGFQLAPATTFTKQKLSFPYKTIFEEGYMFVYLSYDNDSPQWVFFDDLLITHNKSNVVQYNEYYPFGLQTNSSWNRDDTKNDYLYNSGSELNASTGWYETPLRDYDPVIGRFVQVDALASMYGSKTPYHYALNNPVSYNDPSGAYAEPVYWDNAGYDAWRGTRRVGPGSGNHWSDQHRGAEGNLMLMSRNTFRGFYGLDDGYGGTNYDRAAELGNTLAASGASGSVRIVNEGYYSIASVNGQEYNNGWTDLWVAQQGTRVLIIGGADLFFTGLSDEAKGILAGVEGSVHKSAANYAYTVDSDGRFVDDMASSLQQSHAAGQRIIIYGYSKGGDLALQLSRKLNSMNVPVAALITIDVANGWWSNQIDRSVPSNVAINYNFYQTTPGSPLPSYGGPNSGSGLIFNYDLTSPSINHSNIDSATMGTAIFLINSNTR